jgi:hypothetical protein
LRGWTGLFLFAVIALASAAVATRMAADAGSGSDVTVTASIVERTVTIDVVVTGGLPVREIVVRREGTVVGRLLKAPFRYVAADLPSGVHRFELEASRASGSERRAIEIEIPG